MDIQQQIDSAKAWLLITQDNAGTVKATGSCSSEGALAVMKRVAAALEQSDAPKSLVTIETITVEPMPDKTN